MLEFKASNIEELEEEFREKETEIAIEIVKNICDGLDHEADVITLGIMSNLNLDVIIRRKDYLDALNLNMPRVEESEEFELCDRAIKWIKILESEKK